jgi:MarR family transcriptional regulator, transcriptional regulator for hemolysin
MPSTTPVPRTLGFLLRDSARLMRRRFVHMAREAGLPINRSEAAVLVRVDRAPGLSQVQLAEQMDLEPVELVRLIDRLQERGLIERRTHAHDRRVRTLWLTTAAQPVLAQVQAVAAEVRGQALEGIPETEQERLLDLLVVVRSNLTTSSRCPPAGAPVKEAGTHPHR